LSVSEGFFLCFFGAIVVSNDIVKVEILAKASLRLHLGSR
jgi:hypothetical protein